MQSYLEMLEVRATIYEMGGGAYNSVHNRERNREKYLDFSHIFFKCPKETFLS